MESVMSSSEKEKDGSGVTLLNEAMEVYIHEARDIHNICIYQKQDVYAKFCMTGDPENTVSTRIINGGGINPVFNEKVCIKLRSTDSSLKCEIWMLSRIRNYLGDQLLGLALVPVSDILQPDGKLEKDYSLSSTDLFHSPAGFVRLSFAYNGPIPVTAAPVPVAGLDTEPAKSSPCDLEKIEFPDPNVANENCHMVEEYFALPCTPLETQIHSDSSPNAHVQPNSSLLMGSTDSPSTSVSPKASKLPDEEKDNSKETNEPSGLSTDILVMTKTTEREPEVVQQEIVDLYMKSMQQFTDSLAKMKLPVDFEGEPSSSDKKPPASSNSGTRVFYGSGAFF